MNNLRRFSTEVDYNAATLNYPAVSWVVSGNTVYFDKTAPVVVNDKVMMAWHIPSDEASGKDIVLWNGGASYSPTDLFNSLTVNDVDVISDLTADGTLHNYSEPNTDYLVKYDLKMISDQITDIFSGDLGGGWGSDVINVDFLIPSQVTEIQMIPQNTGTLVILAETPPQCAFYSMFGSVYVPDNAVSTYESQWSGIPIYPISEYQGLLPV